MSVLQAIDLKKYYGTEPNITRALDGVNFSVEDGEFVAVVGTSGSGKSTLLHMMGGLDTPTSGTVIVRGRGRENRGTTSVCRPLTETASRVRPTEMGYTPAFVTLARGTAY